MKPILLSTLLLFTFASGYAFAADSVSGSDVSSSGSGAVVEVNGGDHRAPPVHERGPPPQGQMGEMSKGHGPPGPPPGPPPKDDGRPHGPPPGMNDQQGRNGPPSGDGHRPPPPMEGNSSEGSSSSAE